MKLLTLLLILASLTASAQKKPAHGQLWLYDNETIYKSTGYAFKGRYYMKSGGILVRALEPHQNSRVHICYFFADEKKYRKKRNWWSSEIYHYESIQL